MKNEQQNNPVYSCKHKGSSLYDALEHLNLLIWKEGWELPEAICKIQTLYDVSEEKLRDAYNKQL
ncbi:MAG: hypothetical protein HKM01_08385 [Gallionella sp.]|nr:hypothetical protein [Gallionella sp.]